VSLVFDARNGLPWPQIKRFLQTVGREGILKMLSWFDQRQAKAICCIGRYDGQTVHHVVGTCEGSISLTVQWNTDFGRDPIFIPKGYTQTFAQLSKEIKNQISHRALARNQVKALI
jgi:inosine triphosphate pyrophosphatase